MGFERGALPFRRGKQEVREGQRKSGKKKKGCLLEGTLTSDKAADGHIGSGRDCPCDLSAIRQSLELQSHDGSLTS